MDKATADILSKWGLENYIDVFAAEGIDIATMLLLPTSDINTLIPKIGDRIRFETSLKMYRDDLKPGEHSTNRNLDAAIKIIEEGIGDKCEEKSKIPDESMTASGTGGPTSTNSVRVLLESSAEGRQVFEIGVKTGALPVAVRGRMCKLLLESLVTASNPVLPTDAQLLALSNDIGRLFSQESPPLYYAPYLPADAYQAKRNTSGWLVNARRARRAQLISLGLLTKPKSRSGSTSSTQSSKSNPSLGIDLDALEEGDADKVASALEELSSPCPGPWQSVSAIWRETARARLRYLYCEQGTLQEYMNKYPILQSPTNGWRLLELDYSLLFPDKDGGLQCLEASSKKIIDLAKKKGLTSKDKFLRDRIDKELTNIDEAKPESTLIAAISLLGCIFNIPPARRSRKEWQASRAEILDSFVTVVNTESDVQVTLEERRKKYAAMKVTLQPFLIWCSESGVAFAVCDSVLYKFATLPEGINTLFKIFHATGAQYPSESYNIWLIIQLAFFKIRTKYDRPSHSIKETIAKLGFDINSI